MTTRFTERLDQAAGGGGVADLLREAARCGAEATAEELARAGKAAEARRRWELQLLLDESPNPDQIPQLV